MIPARTFEDFETPLDAGVIPAPQVSHGSLPLPLILFLFAIFLPEEGSFNIGDLRMTVARAIMIVFAPVCFYKFFSLVSQGNYRFIWSDLLIPALGVWIIFANAMNDGFSETIKTSGVNALEVVMPYLIARSWLKDRESNFQAMRYFCIGASVVGLLAILDVLTGRYFIRELFSTVTGYIKIIDKDFRFGMIRAASTAEHPILLGSICMLAIIMGTQLKGALRQWVIGSCLIGIFLSVSSAPIGGMLIGLLALLYERTMKRIAFRWVFVFWGIAFFLVAVIAIHPNPRGFLIGLVALNTESAYFRLYLFDWVQPYIEANPFFGIGIRNSIISATDLPTTLDSEWYVLALFDGIPAAVLVFFGLLGALGNSADAKRKKIEMSLDEINLNFALTVCIVLSVYVGTTVLFWGVAQSAVFLTAGLCANSRSLPARSDAQPDEDYGNELELAAVENS